MKPLRKGAGAVRCKWCHAIARADGKGTPIILRHEPGCEEEFPTAICPITEPHATHIIPETTRKECRGIGFNETPHEELIVRAFD